MTKNVLIFSKRVLPISNTFIAAQAQYLKNYTPIFIGFSEDSSGQYLIKDKKTCIQSQFERFPFLSKVLLDGYSFLTKGWKQALQTHNPKLLHAHFGKGGYYSSAIAKALDLPMIVTFHGSDITQKDKFSYNHKHRTKVFQQADKIIASSKFIQQKLILKGCPEEKIIQHYIGIDNEFFFPYGKRNNHPTILFVGRLIKQKGCHYLLKAMQQINQNIPDAELLIVGDGVERKNLEQQASNLKNIRFIGYQNKQKIKDLMSQAWVMCAPSIVLKRGNEEGLGMVFLEAQAMGLPVISFDSGGVGEAVINQKTGLIVEQDNTDALVDSLQTLLNSKATRSEFSLAAIKHIDDNFNLKKQTNTFEKIYDNL
jgi:colanic acid/amylovoran biosynthesis glycosyltransferase